MPNEKAAEPLSEEKLAELEAHTVGKCPCPHTIVCVSKAVAALPSLLAEVRTARAILTPEVLRLIEAGRAFCAFYRKDPRAEGGPELIELHRAALSLPFEKPAEQLPKKGGE